MNKQMAAGTATLAERKWRPVSRTCTKRKLTRGRESRAADMISVCAHIGGYPEHNNVRHTAYAVCCTNTALSHCN